MRQLEIFETVRVCFPGEIKSSILTNLRFGGLLTLTQSGSGSELIKGLKNAYEKNLTCFNVVNVENSPITRAIDEIQKEKIERKQSENQVLFDASDNNSSGLELSDDE